MWKTLVKIPIVFWGDWSWPSRSEVLITLVKIPVVLGVDWTWHVKFNLFSKSCLFASLLRLWNICGTCKKRMKRSLFHILNGYAHICSPTGTCNGPWNSRFVSLVWPLLASQSSTGDWQWSFACFCRLSTNHTYLTCRKFVCQHSVMAETTVKLRAFVFIVFELQNLRRCYF